MGIFNKKTPKSEEDWANSIQTISFTSDEIVEVEHKSSSRKCSFHIGKTDEGNWYAVTDHEQNPKFCFDAVDRDEAYSKGVDALNFYLEHIDKHGH